MQDNTLEERRRKRWHGTNEHLRALSSTGLKTANMLQRGSRGVRFKYLQNKQGLEKKFILDAAAELSLPRGAHSVQVWL